jgi:hypothetical protein
LAVMLGCGRVKCGLSIGPGYRKQPAVTQALYVFKCVVAVAVAVPLGSRQRPPLFTLSEPLGRKAKFACRFGDGVDSLPLRPHALTIKDIEQSLAQDCLAN